MKHLEKEELMNISGGGYKWGLGALIAGGVTFIIGLIDGLLRPLKCN